MNVLIIEDEAPAQRRLEKLLQQARPDIRIKGMADSIESAVRLIQQTAEIDLLFMDIELADGKSFAIFEQINIVQPVVFTTAYDEYAIQAFKVNSVDYLLKPINQEELEKALNKFEALHGQKEQHLPDLAKLLHQLKPIQKQHRNRFLVKTGTRLISLAVEEVAYFMAHEKLVFAVKWDGTKHIMDYTLDELEQMLDEQQFFRANRQFIVHIKAVQSINASVNGKLKLNLLPAPFTQEEISVSRDKAQDFKDWLDY